MLISELLNETGSHLSMKSRGPERAATQADEATILQTTAFINRHRDVKKHREPYTLPGPWPKHDPNADVTPERREELREQLERRSAFR